MNVVHSFCAFLLDQASAVVEVAPQAQVQPAEWLITAASSFSAGYSQVPSGAVVNTNAAGFIVTTFPLLHSRPNTAEHKVCPTSSFSLQRISFARSAVHFASHFIS
jgi:heme A synthase